MLNEEDTRALALAIAHSNNHPDPVGWAAMVVEASKSGTYPVELRPPETPEAPAT